MAFCMHTSSPGYFPDRDGFSGQERLINRDIIGGKEDTIGGDPVTFDKYEHIAGYHFASSNP
ncbi:MAG: hypothetical protein STSR0009_05010 [Methanoregula sp.]